MQNSKIPGVYYFEYVDKDSSKTTVVPSAPPFTTWSGYLECPANSPYAKRLVDKCGGIPYKANLKIEQELEPELKPDADPKAKPAPKIKVVVKTWEEDWVKGFWTAPVDWTEMAAGRESDTPFSPTTYKASDFPFVSLKA